MHPMIQAILARRSVRRYAAQNVEESLLQDILLAGLSAPSAHDSRPWRIAVANTDEGKTKLMDALSARFAADLRAAGVPEEERERRLARSRGIFSSAPVLMVLFAKGETPENPLAKDGGIESLLTAQSVALAAGQILLAASCAGLAGCWFAAPLFCPEEVCAACGLSPEDWLPQCLLTLGYAGEEPEEKSAVDLANSVAFL